MLSLPKPSLRSDVSIEEALLRRRSVRSFTPAAAPLQALSNLLWSAQGITDTDTGYRAAPSAGAIFPLSTYVLASRVAGLETGTWRYLPHEHALEQRSTGDPAAPLAQACFGQSCVADAALTILWAAAYDKLRETYGEMDRKLAWLEVGHSAQNVHLQAISLGLDGVCIGGMLRDGVEPLLGLTADEDPCYALSLGFKA